MRTIAHISDLHFGRHDAAVAEGLLAALERLAPDLVAVTGDLTQRAHRHEFAAARAFLDRIRSPALVVPGNHDVPLYNLLDRWLRPHARFAAAIGPECCPRFVDPEIAVLGLNTVSRRLDRGGGHARPAHIEAIRAGFADVPEPVFRVLLTHHPLLDPDDGRELAATRQVRPVLDAIAAAGVDLLLAGHHHRPFSAEGAIDYLNVKRSLLIVQAGTAISTRLRDGPNSFNLITVDGAGVSCTPQLWTRDGFCAGATARFAEIDGRWRLAGPASGTRDGLGVGVLDS
jgi:3',5'-cyclic AMP phosphodiesterase CpdA